MHLTERRNEPSQHRVRRCLIEVPGEADMVRVCCGLPLAHERWRLRLRVAHVWGGTCGVAHVGMAAARNPLRSWIEIRPPATWFQAPGKRAWCGTQRADYWAWRSIALPTAAPSACATPTSTVTPIRNAWCTAGLTSLHGRRAYAPLPHDLSLSRSAAPKHHPW